MRALPLVLCLAAAGCSAASSGTPSSQLGTPPAVSVPDTVPVRVLMTHGTEALKSMQWAEAADLFSTAHHREPEGELRGQIAFFWAYSLYKQADELARENTSRDPAVATKVMELMEQSRKLLQSSGHPGRERILNAIDGYATRVTER